MKPVIGRCVICQRPARESHHVASRQIDGSFEMPLCYDHHPLMHDDWNTAGVPADQAPPTRLHALQMALARLGMFFGRVANTAEHPIAGQIAAAVATFAESCARELRRDLTLLDLAYPGWREAIADPPSAIPPTGAPPVQG